MVRAVGGLYSRIHLYNMWGLGGLSLSLTSQFGALVAKLFICSLLSDAPICACQVSAKCAPAVQQRSETSTYMARSLSPPEVLEIREPLTCGYASTFAVPVWDISAPTYEDTISSGELNPHQPLG